MQFESHQRNEDSDYEILLPNSMYKHNKKIFFQNDGAPPQILVWGIYSWLNRKDQTNVIAITSLQGVVFLIIYS